MSTTTKKVSKKTHNAAIKNHAKEQEGTGGIPTISSKIPHERFIEICEQYDFVGYSFPCIDFRQNDEGEYKKDPIEQPNWKSINKTNYKKYVKPEHQAFAIITGEANKHSGITVIDCDTPEAYENITKDFPELKDTLTAKTKKGMHIYCKFTPIPKTNTNSFQSYENVDIRTKGGVIFAEPTKYKWVDGNTYTYTFINLGAEIKPFPAKLIADLKDDSRNGQKVVKKNKKAVTKSVTQEDKTNPKLAQQIRDLENQLPLDCRTSRTPWIQLGGIIRHELGNTAEAKQLYLELSKRSPDHTEKVTMDDIAGVWESLGKPKDGKQATIGSLIYAVNKQHSPHLDGFAFLDDVEDEDILHSMMPPLRPTQKPTALTVVALPDTPPVPPTIEEQTVKANVPVAKPDSTHTFCFNNDVTETSLAKFFVQVYGNEFIQTFKVDGSCILLFHWNAKATVWDTMVKARLHIMRLLSDDFFDLLQKQAKRLFGSHRTAVYKALAKFLQTHSSKENIYKEILTYLSLDEGVVFDTCRSQFNNLHFRNGVLMLDKVCIKPSGTVCCDNAFRARVKEDYITETLNWEIGPAEESALNEVKEMFRQIQPEEKKRQFQLDWLAYCLSGHTDAHKFKMNVGYTAENGKSTEAKIQRKVFPLYSTKLPKNIFAESNQKGHKFLIELLEKPIRFAYIEELDRAKLDEDTLKDWVDGEEQTVEVMYGTRLKLLSQAKFTTSSNKDPNANADKGLLRRGTLQHYTSKFVSDPGTNPAPNVFKKTGKLDVLFLQEKYRRAYLWMLLPHVVRYYRDGLVVPEDAVVQFKEVMDQYDAFQTALYEVCENGTDEDRIWKDDLVEALKPKMGAAIKWEKLLPEVKRLGLRYDATVRVGKRGGGQMGNPRGAIIGLKWLDTAPLEDYLDE